MSAAIPKRLLGGAPREGVQRRARNARQPGRRRFARRFSTGPTPTACRTTSSTSVASPRPRSITCRRRASRTATRRRASSASPSRPTSALLWLDAALGEGRHRRRAGIERRVEKLEHSRRRGIRHRRPRRPGRRDARHERSVHGRRSRTPKSACPIMQRQPWAYDLSVNGELSLLELQHRQDDQFLRDRRRLGADQGSQDPRQLPAGGPRGEHRRALHRAGLQPVQRRAIPARGPHADRHARAVR